MCTVLDTILITSLIHINVICHLFCFFCVGLSLKEILGKMSIFRSLQSGCEIISCLFIQEQQIKKLLT